MEADTPRRMIIRRTSPLGDRRRRLVLDHDPTGPAVTSEAAAPRGNQPPRRYAAEALPEHQPSWCDLLPWSRWALGGCLLAGLVLSLGLMGLDSGARALETRFEMSLDLSPLQFHGSRNVAQAAKALILLAAAGLCRAIAHLRRFRIDDYRGRYRVWYYFTAIALILALHACSDVLHVAHDLFVLSVSRLRLPYIDTWPQVAGYVFLTAAGIRLTQEICSCRVATLAGWCGGILLVTAELARGPLRSVLEFRSVAWLPVFTQLLGCYMVMFSLMLFARHVLLDAQNLLASPPAAVRRRRKKTPPAANPSSATVTGPTPSPNGDATKSDARAGTSQAPTATTKPSKPTSSTETRRTASVAPKDDDTPLPIADHVGLSRAERKRLAKDRQRQRRAA